MKKTKVKQKIVIPLIIVAALVLPGLATFAVINHFRGEQGNDSDSSQTLSEEEKEAIAKDAQALEEEGAELASNDHDEAVSKYSEAKELYTKLEDEDKATEMQMLIENTEENKTFVEEVRKTEEKPPLPGTGG